MTGDLARAELETLGHLLSACGRPVELDFLIDEYRTTPKQINHCIDQLIRHGCRIERDMQSAWLIGSGLGVWSDYLNHALTDSPPRDIEVYQKTASTQDIAKSRAGKPLIVLADEQTGGRGRLGRRWLAPPGTGLLFSMTHTPPLDAPDTIDRVAFLTAVAVAQAIEHVTGHGLIQIKWPNDLTVGRRKLAGILVETVSQGPKSPPSLVIGVGINVGLTREHIHTMPPELQPSVTSFACEGWPADRLYLAEHVIARIDRNLGERNIPALVDEWRVRNLFRDQSIRLANAGRTITGTVMDLDPDDGLIVRRDSGEIVHLPAATTTVLV
jgi:BirA family biotin operon repressor/biotin-[acetyl-CoA-carboxylase] ligase